MTNTLPTKLIDTMDRLDQRDTEELQQAIERLREALRYRMDCDYLYDSWHVDDILCRRPDLNIDQCREVLQLIDRRRDASIGINWDVIDIFAADCYPEPDNLDAVRDQAEEDSCY